MKNIFQKTSHAFVWLVFFFLMSCTQSPRQEHVEVVYTDGHAMEVLIPRHLLEGTEENIRGSLSVHLQGQSQPMLGEIDMENEKVAFEPVLPFRPGKTYEIKFKQKLITSVTIKEGERSIQESGNPIFPSVDTIPENLLKIYIGFPEPMQEGVALEHLLMIRNEKDTISGIFLDLQPELWNKERTMLTLWLDPGRIKRDLQPNQTMGKPLKAGEHYRLVVKEGWQTAKGKLLFAPPQKKYVVGPRDDQKPDHNSWRINAPRAETRVDLEIELTEPLDQVLLMNTISIKDNKGNRLGGSIMTKNDESTFVFIPEKEWVAGYYTLEIESRLEDLAGNNLNRLFEQDLTKKSKVETREVYSRTFLIQ